MINERQELIKNIVKIQKLSPYRFAIILFLVGAIYPIFRLIKSIEPNEPFLSWDFSYILVYFLILLFTFFIFLILYRKKIREAKRGINEMLDELKRDSNPDK